MLKRAREKEQGGVVLCRNRAVWLMENIRLRDLGFEHLWSFQRMEMLLRRIISKAILCFVIIKQN